MYKMAGFTNKTNLKIISGSTSPLSTARSIFIPEENYKIFMNKSTPIDTVNYSAVIVQRVTMDDSSAGYQISGYNQAERYFKILPSIQNNNATSITVGGATELCKMLGTTFLSEYTRFIDLPSKIKKLGG